MKRLFVTLAHPQHAGMWRALRVLADVAPAHGWEMRYAVPAWHELIETTGIPPAHVTVVPGLGAWRRGAERLRLPMTLLRLARAARGSSALYSTTLSTFPHCWLAGRVLGIAQVVHVYSSYGTARPYRKHWLARARHVIAPSADSLRLAQEAIGGFGPATRARVIYNGMDVDRIRAEAAGEVPAGLRDGTGPRIGMVGNLDWRKNPTCLIDATPAIRAAIPSVSVLLVGAFPDAKTEGKVRGRISALGLDDVIRVTGFLSNPFPVVRRLDVLVHPALRDPFPLALLEGMALERPIVASAVGGIPEMLVDGESGRLVPAQDPAALASAVVALLGDEAARARMGAAAYRRLTTTFTLDGFGAAMWKAFDEAAAEGGRAMTPEVSVVVPTYNRAAFIADSVATLLAQEGVRLEVIVVDDGSTDDTLARLGAIADPRLRVVTAPHAGIGAARNAGVAACAGRFVAFHDSDDVALPGRLARPVAVLEAQPELGVVIQNGRFLPPEDAPSTAPEPWIKPEVTRVLTGRAIGVGEVFRWNLGQLQGMCFTRFALDTVGPFDTSYRILDDLDLVLRVAARFPAVFLDEEAFLYRRHGGGIARDRATVREEAIRLAEKLVNLHPEVLPLLGRDDFNRRQARRYSRLARARMRTGDALGARDALTRARALRPLNLRYRLASLWLRLRPRS